MRQVGVLQYRRYWYTFLTQTETPLLLSCLCRHIKDRALFEALHSVSLPCHDFKAECSILSTRVIKYGTVSVTPTHP